MEKKEAKKKSSAVTVSVDALIEMIGSKLEAMNENEGSLESYYNILEEELGNRDFKAMNATEKQREQVEQILAALEAKGY
jgi:predicted kinase